MTPSHGQEWSLFNGAISFGNDGNDGNNENDGNDGNDGENAKGTVSKNKGLGKYDVSITNGKEVLNDISHIGNSVFNIAKKQRLAAREPFDRNIP